MRTKILQFVVILYLWLFCGCGQDTGYRAEGLPASSNAADAKARFGEEEFTNFVRKGMSKQTITNQFGKPDLVMEIQDGYERFDYFFSQGRQHAPRASFVSGITIYLKDDAVFRWAPIYTSGSHGGQEMVPVKREVANSPQADAASAVSVWIVSTTPIDGGRYIDTERLPKLGYIANQPALQFKQLKSLKETKGTGGNKGDSKLENLELHATLLDEDALAFRDFTGQNIRKRVLLMVGNRPIMAPLLIAPVPSGIIRIPCDDLREFRELREELAAFVPSK